MNDQGAGIALAFFGFAKIRERLFDYPLNLPAALVGCVVGGFWGLGWLTFLHPPLGYRAFPIIVLLAYWVQ